MSHMRAAVAMLVAKDAKIEVLEAEERILTKEVKRLRDANLLAQRENCDLYRKLDYLREVNQTHIRTIELLALSLKKNAS